MTRLIGLSLGLAAAVSVSACETPQQENALVGGALGGGTGALVGSAVSGGSAGGRCDRRDVRRHDRRGGDASADLLRRVAAARMRPVGQRLQRQPHLHRFLLVSRASGRSRDKGTAKASS